MKSWPKFQKCGLCYRQIWERYRKKYPDASNNQMKLNFGKDLIQFQSIIMLFAILTTVEKK